MVWVWLGDVAFALRYGRQELASGVTSTGVASLRPGMNTEDVDRLVGKPLSARYNADKSESWVYSIPCALSKNCRFNGIGEGLELSIQVVDGEFVGGGAEFWDLSVWSCSPYACPENHDPSVLNRVLPK